MTESILKYVFGLAGIIISGITGWFIKRKKTTADIAKKNAEIKKLEADVEKTKADSNELIIGQYKKALDDLKQRYDERYSYLEAEFERRHNDLVADYERKYKALKEEKDNEINQLTRKVKNLSEKLEYWKKMYKELDK